jgi:peptidoglycan hydrolase-like protein with peptidoglycan-binding domain
VKTWTDEAEEAGSSGAAAEVERWNYEVETPFRPPHEIAELAFEGPAPLEAYAFEQEGGGDRPTLRPGSRGDAVRLLQQALNTTGAGLATDGIFGPATEAAVRAFQVTNGLTADGIVGPQTWRRLPVAIPATPTTPSMPAPQATGAAVVPSGVPADVPSGPLGTLSLSAPNRSFRYSFTQEDLVWTAKLIVHETGGQENNESAAVLWAMFNDYAFIKHRRYAKFSDYIRRYSTTLQPVLANWQAAARHYRSPSFVRTGGTYADAPHIPRGQLQRHLDIQRAPWSAVKPSARRMALRALRGELSNPGIGNANEFVSTRILFRQRHGREPSSAEWRQFTEQFKRSKMRWIGDVPGLDQTKNAFFVSHSIASAPAGAVRVEPPGTPAEDASGEMFEAAYGDFEDEVDQAETDAFEALFEDEDESFYEEFAAATANDLGESIPGDEAAIEPVDELEEGEASQSEAALETDPALETEVALDAQPTIGLEEEVNRRSPAYVRWIQSSLNQVHGAGLTVDGISGPRTQAAVRQFQASSGLAVDGIVGPNTERALRAAGASPPPSATTAPTVSPTPAAPSTGGPGPTMPPLQGGPPRSSQWIRNAWNGHHCADGRMRRVRVQGWNTPVNALAADAYLAFDRVLQASGYAADRAWSYVCRKIGNSARPSLHAYGLAIDIDPPCNPHRVGRPGPARFSAGATKADRCADVRARRADTIFTPAQITAIEAIRTVDGLRVFNWGGRWRSDPDAMHFQLNLSPAELARGLAP